MRRRYPRLSATDYCGRSVAIPITIAPVLYPHERFTSLSQDKVLEISEANKRLKREEEQRPNNEFTNKRHILPVKKREKVVLSHGSSVTDTPCSKDSSNTEISTPESVSLKRRFWSSAEDDIVLCAVLMKETGKCLVERLPHRSRSAVMQRFYLIKERHRQGLREKERGDNGEVDACGGDAKVEDEEMDEISPI